MFFLVFLIVCPCKPFSTNDNITPELEQHTQITWTVQLKYDMHTMKWKIEDQLH